MMTPGGLDFEHWSTLCDPSLPGARAVVLKDAPLVAPDDARADLPEKGMSRQYTCGINIELAGDGRFRSREMLSQILYRM